MQSRLSCVFCIILYSLTGACLSPPGEGDSIADMASVEGIYQGVNVPSAVQANNGSTTDTNPNGSAVSSSDEVPSPQGSTGSTTTTNPSGSTSVAAKAVSTGFWMQSMDRPDLCVAAVSADGNTRSAMRLVACADDERQLFTAAIATYAFFCLQPNRRCIGGAIDSNGTAAQPIYITKVGETGYTLRNPLSGVDPLYPQVAFSSKSFALFYNPANATGADLYAMPDSTTESGTAKKLNVVRANSSSAAGFTIRSATNLSVCLTDRSGTIAAERCVKGDARQRWSSPIYGGGGTGMAQPNKFNTVKLVSGSNRCIWAPTSTQRPTAVLLGSCSDANALLTMSPGDSRGMSLVRSDGDISLPDFLTMDPNALQVLYYNYQTLSLRTNYTPVAGGYE